jgi:hypothetical protein
MPIAEHSLELLDANGDSLDPAVKPYFLSIKGNVPMRQQQLEKIGRRGVDGHGFRQTGVRGKSFQIITVVDAPSGPAASSADGLRAARLAVAGDIYRLTYRTMSGTGVVRMIKDDVDWGLYVVEDVQIVSLRACTNMQGGFSPVDTDYLGLPAGYTISEGPSAARLTCRWTLAS